ncbi:MAG: D-aminoacyl-tRNA deacylase [Thermoprotei archaeon]
MGCVVVFSTNDEAGINITSQLRQLIPNAPIVAVEKDLIDLKSPDVPRADLVVFASKHVGKLPSFTVHVSGNPGSEAPFGGVPYEVSVSAPLPMRVALETMKRLASPGFQVTYEVTHHGPSDLKVPSFFAELGSGPSQWSVPEHARVVAEGIAEVLRNCGNWKQFRPVLGLGGPHYAPNITKYVLKSDVAVGHIVQGSILEENDPERVIDVVLKANGNTSALLLDWKGVKGEVRQKVLDVAARRGLPVLRA